MSLKPTIHLAFVDDWELRGNGSGDVRELQLRPMRELVMIFNRYGIHGSFNAEVMQQLTFRKFQSAHHELRELADEWDDSIRETFRQGHDVQLHTHPQWCGAQYENGEWKLTADWSILNYEPDKARRIVLDGKEYLENLLRPVDANYQCVSFRSGSWCIAPSPHLLDLLANLGIIFDMSMVGGVNYATRNINLDYTSCDETFLPYYPVMTDARRVAHEKQRIICVPTNHFYGSRRQVFRHHVSLVVRKLKKLIAPAVTSKSKSGPNLESYSQEWAQTSHESTLTRLYEKGVIPYFKGKHLISDIAQLDYDLLKEMLDSIRRRALSTGLQEIPVILENHTKDIQDFSDIERFVKDVSESPDIECITLTELARGLEDGRFHIMKTNKPK